METVKSECVSEAEVEIKKDEPASDDSIEINTAVTDAQTDAEVEITKDEPANDDGIEKDTAESDAQTETKDEITKDEPVSDDAIGKNAAAEASELHNEAPKEEEKPDLKFAVVGAGAIGGIIAAMLTKGGYDVELVCKHEAIAEKARTAGIKIGGLENLTVKVKAVAKESQLSGKKDVIIIATKAYDLQNAAKSLLYYAHNKTLFVSVQSGISAQALSAVVGENRAAACVIGFSAVMNGPADITKTENGYILLGSLTHHEKIVDHCGIALQSVCPTYISDMILSELLSKLVIDSSLCTLSAICGLAPDEMLQLKKAQKLFLGLVKEAISASQKLEIYIPSYSEQVDYHELVLGGGYFKRSIKVLGEHFKNRKLPDAQSLQRGELTETDYTNGYIVKLAEQAGIKVPLNKALLQLIKMIENRKMSISPANLNSPEFNKK